MNAPADPSRAAPTADAERLFALQRAAFERERYPTYAARRDRLARLLDLVAGHERELCAAAVSGAVAAATAARSN